LYIYNSNHPQQTAPMSLTLNLPAGRYRITYVAPETGRKQKKKLRHSGGLATLTTPAFGADLGVIIRTTVGRPMSL
jgi:hypothetical protein